MQHFLKSCSFVVLASGFAATSARADLLPGRGEGHKVRKCTEVASNNDQPDQGQLDQFLNDVAYTAVSDPEITKLDNGSYKVCAVFTR